MLFASQMGKDRNDSVTFGSVVWPAARHFLNWLQEQVFLLIYQVRNQPQRQFAYGVIYILSDGTQG